MIPRKTIDQIFDAAKIEDVVQDFVTLKRRGVNLIGLCPFHNEKTPSFTVSPSRNIFKCFGCGKGGNPVHFIMEHEHMTYPDALRYIARKYNIEVEEYVPSAEEVEKQKYFDSLHIVNQYALEHFENNLFDTDEGKAIGLSYFKERGFREDTIKKFHLGYAIDRPKHFADKAVEDGYKMELLQSLGLVSTNGYDFFRGRVIFPIFSFAGKPIAFGGRVMQKNTKQAKYKNSPETEVYSKRKTLYGMYFAKNAIRKKEECILVEGYTDVISLHQAGYENVVASSGTSLTVEQISLIRRLTENVKILYDGDSAGQAATGRGVDLILAQGLNVKIVTLPEDEDPDSYLRKVGAEAFGEYIEQNAKDFILHKTGFLAKSAAGDPVKKANILKEIINSIASVPDPAKRSFFIKECSLILEMEEGILVDATNKAVRSLFQKRKQQKKREANAAGRVSDSPAPDAQKDAETIATPASRPLSGDEFQEKDIVRILIAGGDKVFDKNAEEKISVAEYIVSNIQDILDEFDNKYYQTIVGEVIDLLNKDETVNAAYFINHENEKISEIAIDVLQSPYEYSPGWEKKEYYLNAQPMPDKNFSKDSRSAVLRFRLKKIERSINKNKERIKKAQEENDEEALMQFLAVHKKLFEIRATIAAKLKTVVVR